MIQKLNPLNFYCPPNGCTPEYIPYTNFEAFIAYGLVKSYINELDYCFLVTDDKIKELRLQFLDLMEKVVNPEVDKIDWGNVDIGDINVIEFENRKGYIEYGETTELYWWVDSVDIDYITIGMYCQGTDPLILWLSKKALNCQLDCIEILRKARRIINVMD